MSPLLSEEEQHQIQDGVFIPSERQRAFLHQLMIFDGSPTIAGLCKKSGISRNTFYEWRRLPEFAAWLNTHRQRLKDSEIIFIDKVVHALARKGDLRAAKLAYEMRGELYSRLDVDLTGTVRVEKDPAALSRLIEMVMLMRLPSGVQSGRQLPAPQQEEDRG